MLKTNLARVIKIEEGYSEVPYLCSEGYVTIGYGTKLYNGKGMDPSGFCIRIDTSTAMSLLLNHINEIQNRLLLSNVSSIYNSLTDTRKVIILSMCYQLGVSGVIKFKKMWKALEEGNYEEAAHQMLDSTWNKQTPNRAIRHAEVMKSDSMETYNI